MWHLHVMVLHGCYWTIFFLKTQYTVTCLKQIKIIRTMVYYNKEIWWIHSNTRLAMVLTCSGIAVCYSIVFALIPNIQLHVHKRRNQLKR
jgi:hypothetical protein